MTKIKNHNCQLPAAKTDPYTDLEDVAFYRFLRYLTRYFMISKKNLNCKRYITSRAYIIYEKRRHLRYYRHTIHPFSMFSFYWDIFMVLITTSGLIYVPYEASFNFKEYLEWDFIEVIILANTWVDVIVNCLTGYLDTKSNFIEMNHKSIIRRYLLRGTLIPDLLASIPTDLFFLSYYSNLVLARKMVSFIYLFRVFAMFKYLNKLSRAFNLPRHAYEFCMTIFWLVLFLHWQSCIYWIVPFFAVSWAGIEVPKNDSWIHGLSHWDKSVGSSYPKGLYRSVVTITRSGFPIPNLPRNAEDQYSAICLQVFTSAYAIYENLLIRYQKIVWESLEIVISAFANYILIANMMQFFKGVNSAKLKYQVNLVRLNEYMRHKQLPQYMQRRLNNFYDFKYQKHYFQESEILSNFSEHLNQEIRMYTCRKLVENVYFFHDLPLSMLVRIVSLLKSDIFLTNDVIVQAGQIGHCMYFISTGIVAVYTNMGKEVCHLDSGAHFGEIALVMPDARRVATVVAVDSCMVYRLERGDFIRTIHPYPLLWERIKKIAYERIERTAMLNVQ